MSIDRTPAGPLPQSADPKIFGPALNWWRETFQRLGRLPSRSDLLPDYLTPAALPHVVMVDIAEGGEKLRFRLLGTAHVDWNKQDLTGKYFDEVFAPGSPPLAYIKAVYRDLIELRRPIWTVNNVIYRKSDFGDGLPIKIRRLMLPLTMNGEEVNLSLAIQTIEFNQQLGAGFRDLWHCADFIGEVEREVLSV